MMDIQSLKRDQPLPPRRSKPKAATDVAIEVEEVDVVTTDPNVLTPFAQETDLQQPARTQQQQEQTMSDRARMVANDVLKYRCDKCPSRFTNASFLQTHTIKAHSKPKDVQNATGDFKCAFCGVEFHTYTLFHAHQKGCGRSHALQWSSCIYCAETFRQRSDYHKHLAEAHKATPTSHQTVANLGLTQRLPHPLPQRHATHPPSSHSHRNQSSSFVAVTATTTRPASHGQQSQLGKRKNRAQTPSGAAKQPKVENFQAKAETETNKIPYADEKIDVEENAGDIKQEVADELAAFSETVQQQQQQQQQATVSQQECVKSEPDMTIDQQATTHSTRQRQDSTQCICGQDCDGMCVAAVQLLRLSQSNVVNPQFDSASFVAHSTSSTPGSSHMTATNLIPQAQYEDDTVIDVLTYNIDDDYSRTMMTNNNNNNDANPIDNNNEVCYSRPPTVAWKDHYVRSQFGYVLAKQRVPYHIPPKRVHVSNGRKRRSPETRRQTESFQCSRCPKVFSRFDALQVHALEKHQIRYHVRGDSNSPRPTPGLSPALGVGAR